MGEDVTSLHGIIHLCDIDFSVMMMSIRSTFCVRGCFQSSLCFCAEGKGEEVVRDGSNFSNIRTETDMPVGSRADGDFHNFHISFEI